MRDKLFGGLQPRALSHFLIRVKLTMVSLPAFAFKISDSAKVSQIRSNHATFVSRGDCRNRDIKVVY